MNNKYFNIKQGPQGIAYDRPILTVQTTSYRTGDDGWHFANGTYDYTPPTFPVSYATLDTTGAVPFNTLLFDNAFGNTDRFTDINGLQVYGDDYVIDHLSGLGYYKVRLPSALNWNDNIDSGVTMTIAGFTDWRLANTEEAENIYNKGLPNPLNYAPFNTFGNAHIVFTSTTRKASTTQAWYLSSSSGAKTVVGKTSLFWSMYVRNHYN